jgi:7-carboxy-7-deazaguanine synthase
VLINEIYPAICGESRFTGVPCTLVRLTGCHLRCAWCDSEHSFQGGERLNAAQVADRVAGNGLPTVLVTGGEPLLQAEVGELMSELLARGHTVLLETSGAVLPVNALPLDRVPAGVHRIVDVKAPGSGIPESTIDWDGLAHLGSQDELKIVCVGRADYEWARDLVRSGRLPAGVPVSLSSAHGSLERRELAEWILADRLDVRFQLQLHKVVWPDVERGV